MASSNFFKRSMRLLRSLCKLETMTILITITLATTLSSFRTVGDCNDNYNSNGNKYYFFVEGYEPPFDNIMYTALKPSNCWQLVNTGQKINLDNNNIDNNNNDNNNNNNKAQVLNQTNIIGCTSAQGGTIGIASHEINNQKDLDNLFSLASSKTEAGLQPVPFKVLVNSNFLTTHILDEISNKLQGMLRMYIHVNVYVCISP